MPHGTINVSLKFPGEWRFRLPPILLPINSKAIGEFYDLIAKIGAQTDSWDNLERFKTEFAAVSGTISMRSSSESWAMTDLFTVMENASKNPPLFMQALHSGFLAARKRDLAVPDDEIINKVLRENGIPLSLDHDSLTLVEDVTKSVPVPPPPPSMQELAAQMLEQSVKRSEELLMNGRGREAVQELLWVLESLVTGFRGTSLPTGEVKGKYFNQIVKELKAGSPNTTLERAIEWCESLHGYLSSPTGGKVRHGLDINTATSLATEDARFFCNLIRSYVGYFQSEYHKTRGNL